MRPYHLVSWLDRYLEALQTENEAQTRFVEQTVSDLAALYRLVRMLWAVLQPVHPNPQFRGELKQNLIAEAQRRQVQDALGLQIPATAARRRWWRPVAVLGTASLVGVYALWRRSRPHEVEDVGLAA